MSKKTPKPPTPIDPNLLIHAQEQANRVNRITPFGSQIYGTGPNGETTFTTNLSPQMQGLVDRGMGIAGQNLTPLSPAPGLQDLQSALINKVSSHYGQQPQQQQKPQLQQLQSIAGQPVNPIWNQALGQLWNQNRG